MQNERGAYQLRDLSRTLNQIGAVLHACRHRTLVMRPLAAGDP